MGRPKMSEEEKLAARQKRLELSKTIMQHYKENPSLDTSNSELKPNQALVNKPETKQVAYSIAKDKDTGRWYVIKIMYDLVSGAVSSPVKLGEGDDRSIAFERFKIEAGTAFMGDL